MALGNQGHMHRIARLLRVISAALAWQAAPAFAQDKIGVPMLHGKNPGGPDDPYFGSLRSKLDGDGMLVLMPDMPRLARRYGDGDWDKAMTEIAAHVKKLRDSGATKIVLAGHSMGCPAALRYAARHGDDIDALVLQAPGHVPYCCYNAPSLKLVRDSIDEARALVAAGKGDTRKDFNDINQGRPLAVRLTARVPVLLGPGVGCRDVAHRTASSIAYPQLGGGRRQGSFAQPRPQPPVRETTGQSEAPIPRARGNAFDDATNLHPGNLGLDQEGGSELGAPR